jgi:hypothetical protein
MTVLFARRVHHGHDPLGESIATLALRAKRAFAPQYEGTQLLFSVVVGRLDTYSIYERP